MNVEKIIGLAMVCAVLIVILRNSRPEQALILSIAAATLLLLWLLDSMTPIIAEVMRVIDLFAFGSQQSEIMLKSFGLCLLTQSAADVCRDAGEQSLALNVELAGKTTVLLLCLPLFGQLLELAVTLLN